MTRSPTALRRAVVFAFSASLRFASLLASPSFYLLLRHSLCKTIVETMATLAALRSYSSVKRHPFAYASASTLAAAAGYAALIERETERRESAFYATTARHIIENNSSKARKFTLDCTDGVTHIERRATTATAPTPPPSLPREYDSQAIEDYWSARPVSVVRRIGVIGRELMPLLFRFVRDFKIGAGENDRSHEDSLALQRQHARDLKDALTRLGPAFVKMGQQLSIRPDLVPPAVLAELQKLCDSVDPVPDEVALDVLRNELKCDDLSEVFTGLRRVAAASLGQVYRGTIKETGDVVAVKVQRPDMIRKLSLDLFLLQSYGQMMDSICSVLTNQIPYHSNFMNAFASGSYMELDYKHEAANQLKFKREFEKRRCNVKVPNVFQAYTTRKVICSEWIEGTKLVDAPRKDIRKLIPVGVELFLTQLLDIGAFHSDPHPANIYVTRGGQLALLDFGLCAEIDERAQRAMTAAIVNLLHGDYHSLIATDAKELGFLPQDLDVTELKPILTKILTEGLVESGSNLHERKRKLLDISNELNEVFFQYPFTVPPFFALITRGLALLEGIALSGDPEFDIFRASLPYAKKRAVALFGPRFLASSGLAKLQRRPTIEG